MPEPPDLAAVIASVAQYSAVPAGRIRAESQLLRDLGIDGADGWELIEAFGSHFAVDLDPFQPRRHFGVEGQFRLTPRNNTPILISDLHASALAGRWTVSAGESAV